MRSESSLSHSQQPATCPCPEPYRSSPFPQSHFSKIHFNIVLPSMPGSSKWYFWGFKPGRLKRQISSKCRNIYWRKQRYIPVQWLSYGVDKRGGGGQCLDFRQGQGIYLFSTTVQTTSGFHPACYSVDITGSLQGINWPFTSICSKIRNAWKYTSTPTILLWSGQGKLYLLLMDHWATNSVP